MRRAGQHSVRLAKMQYNRLGLALQHEILGGAVQRPINEILGFLEGSPFLIIFSFLDMKVKTYKVIVLKMKW